jgi:diguanylate cyclase (GGDEF)-like protein
MQKCVSELRETAMKKLRSFADKWSGMSVPSLPTHQFGAAQVDAVGGAGISRRTIGRAAGVLICVSAIVGYVTMRLLSDHHIVTSGFVILSAASLCVGIACLIVPWERLPGWWLHLLPAFATVDIAVGIRITDLNGDIASSYYLFVAAFAAYAFNRRREIVAQVAFAGLASALPLLSHYRAASHTPARVVTGILLLVGISGIITFLREGLQKRQRELELLAIRDPLTGVGNYRLMSDRLDYEIARHRRSAQELTVMLLDLDGFKDINDSFGHLVGDSVLIQVARGITSCVRSQDTVARQGGDEFSILAPHTDHEKAAVLASRVQEAVRLATNGAVTTSIGWVTFPTHADDAPALLDLADAALRTAKASRGGSGRGRPQETPRAGQPRLEAAIG